MARHTLPPFLRREVAARFRALGDETRLEILQRLIAGGPMSVGDLAGAIEGSHANVSKHLRVLHDAGLVEREKRGTSVYYTVADANIESICELACARIIELAETRAREIVAPAAG